MLAFFISPHPVRNKFQKQFDTTTRAKTGLPKHWALFIFFIFLKFVQQKLKQNEHFVCMYM